MSNVKLGQYLFCTTDIIHQLVAHKKPAHKKPTQTYSDIRREQAMLDRTGTLSARAASTVVKARQEEAKEALRKAQDRTTKHLESKSSTPNNSSFKPAMLVLDRTLTGLPASVLSTSFLYIMTSISELHQVTELDSTTPYQSFMS